MRPTILHSTPRSAPGIQQSWPTRIITPLAILCFLLLSACNLHFDVDSVEQPIDAPDASNNKPEPGPELKDCTADGAKECNGTCRDTMNDPWNCGACGNLCEGSESCVNGQCYSTSCPDLEGRPTACNPVLQTGACNFNDETCTLRLTFANGAPSHFKVECRTRPFSGTPVDSPCSQDDECTEGAYCTSWEKPDPRGRVCSRFCDLASGEGCNANEFCTNPYDDLLEGFGFCTPRCDPLDAKACPQGAACAPDFELGQNSCHPNFRCLQNGGTSQKSTGSPCNTADLHTDGCPKDLTCIENQCAKPCATSDDCTDAKQPACRQAPEPWSASRFCQKE